MHLASHKTYWNKLLIQRRMLAVLSESGDGNMTNFKYCKVNKKHRSGINTITMIRNQYNHKDQELIQLHKALITNLFIRTGIYYRSVPSGRASSVIFYWACNFFLAAAYTWQC